MIPIENHKLDRSRLMIAAYYLGHRDLKNDFSKKQPFTKKGENTCSRWWQLKYFIVLTLFGGGEDSHFDEHIFQMGWFNHQLDVTLTESNK